ncbi:hypothetical protein EGR_10276 [Echinococcus granulosus]|uniref:Uncharacterized protein n=1 Tax=Echinococcus granulosus TaxID=6210 RepID=W6U1D7_ECHGR|nr:hypothetical protein EGR_10276 [Echinococcus granulosus]EUB54858.1 hypothetical protein EGR_10276 [Echinococcus granulosus]
MLSNAQCQYHVNVIIFTLCRVSTSSSPLRHPTLTSLYLLSSSASSITFTTHNASPPPDKPSLLSHDTDGMT